MFSETDSDKRFFDETFLKRLLSFLDESDKLSATDSGYSSELTAFDSSESASLRNYSENDPLSLRTSPVKRKDKKCMLSKPNSSESNKELYLKLSEEDIFKGKMTIQRTKNLLFANCLSNLLFDGKVVKKDVQAYVNITYPFTMDRTSSPANQERNLLSKDIKLCSFCFKNDEPEIVYFGHFLKTCEGVITCPILRRHTCEICGATGSNAHTKKYCPLNPRLHQKIPQFRKLTNGVVSWSPGHK